MQEDFIIEIDDLKSCLQSSKRVSVGKELILEPKDSQATFDFSKISYGLKIKSINLFFKRIAGNGEFVIDNQTYFVRNKTSQYFAIPISSQQLKIYRTKTSIGEIVLQKIVLNLYEDMAQNNQWKQIVNQFTNYSGLRLQNNKLNAVIGAFIQDDYKIDVIETNPTNVFNRIGNKIKFIQSCEIVELKLKQNQVEIKPHQEVFIHREIEKPIQQNFSNQTLLQTNNKELQIPYDNQSQVLYDSNQSQILYDSSKAKLVPGSGSINAKLIKQGSQNFIVLNKGGIFNFGLSSLQSNTDYTFIISAKKVSGNGKMNVVFGSDKKELILNSNLSDYVLKLNSNQNFIDGIKLTIRVQDEISKNEILITKIVISSQTKIQNSYTINQPFVYNSISTTNIQANSEYKSDDIVRDTFKNYAQFNFETLQKFSDLSGKINFKSRYGQKIKLICSNIVQDENADLTFCLINNLKNSRKIYLDEFDESTDPELNLSNVKYIFSPSEQNIYWLKNKYPDIISLLIPKFWPSIQSQEIQILKNKQFFLTLNRCPEYIFELAKTGIKNLVVVGARGQYPENVIPMNEYLPYYNLIWLIKNCQVILDFPIHTTNYNSGFLQLASDLGKPIITSNQLPDSNVINQNYMISDYEICGKLLPTPQDVFKLCQQKFESLPEKSEQEINQKLVDVLSVMINL